MENASKALIIGGAILLAVLIVALGMTVYNRVSDVGNSASVDSQKAQAFNASFEPYIGPNVRGSNVRLLLDAVAANNRTTDDDSTKIKIYAKDVDGLNDTNGVDEAATITQAKSKIGTGYTYYVGIDLDAKGDGKGYDSSSGYIHKIWIEKQNS